MEINGFTFSSRLIGTSACYHIAKRGNTVFTSKDMNYLIRKAKNYGRLPDWLVNSKVLPSSVATETK